MSGETEEAVSAWTPDTIKILHDRDLAHLKEMSELRDRHEREMREANETHSEAIRGLDQKALDLAQTNTDLHFLHVNGEQGRTAMERANFVTTDTFEPFQKQVLGFISEARGGQLTVGKLIAGLTVASLSIGIVVLLANWVSSGV